MNIKIHKPGCLANVSCLVIHPEGGICPGPYGKCTCDTVFPSNEGTLGKVNKKIEQQEVCGVSMKIGYATSEDGSITVSQFGTCLGKKGNCSLHDSPTPKKEVVPDSDLCVMCYAYGEDKRHLRMRCMYAIDEMVPEMIFNKENKMYEAWICKSCRGSLLGKMKEWRLERVELRDKTKDHDGYLEEDEDPTRDIPVRINGAIVMMNEEEYEKYKRTK